MRCMACSFLLYMLLSCGMFNCLKPSARMRATCVPDLITSHCPGKDPGVIVKVCCLSAARTYSAVGKTKYSWGVYVLVSDYIHFSQSPTTGKSRPFLKSYSTNPRDLSTTRTPKLAYPTQRSERVRGEKITHKAASRVYSPTIKLGAGKRDGSRKPPWNFPKCGPIMSRETPFPAPSQGSPSAPTVPDTRISRDPI